MPLTTILGSAVQPVLNPPHCPLIQSTLPEFSYEDLVGDSVESLAEPKVDNIHHSHLIHPGSCFSKEYDYGCKDTYIQPVGNAEELGGLIL